LRIKKQVSSQEFYAERECTAAATRMARSGDPVPIPL